MDLSDKLIEAGLALASEHELDVVLQRIVELACEITGARYGALGVLGADEAIVAFITHGVTQDERAAIGEPPTGRGILGLLIRERRPMRIPIISRDPHSFGFPPNHPTMRSFLGAPVVARDQVYGNIYLTEKQDADEFDEADESALVVLAAQAGVAIENARLIEETDRRARVLHAVHEIATSILSGSNPDEALQLVARRARELASADVATIAVPADSGQLAIRVADGLNADELRGTVFPLGESVSGHVIRTRRAEILDDASEDRRVYQPVVAVGDFGPAMFVPLSARGQTSGTLTVCNRRGGPTFGSADLRLVETFADQAGVVLEYARALGEIQRLALLEDRERIAKELHDGIIQSLFAVGMGLQGTAALVEEGHRDRIEGAIGEIDRAIRDLRNYIFGLRPGILADRQLDQALRRLAEDHEKQFGVLVAVDVDAGVAAELASRAIDVIQLAREALSNVGKHSGAATCRLSLRRDAQGAVLKIDDDGKGFDAGAPKAGMGLGNLRERAASLGGEATIESSPADGTTVKIAMPL